MEIWSCPNLLVQTSVNTDLGPDPAGLTETEPDSVYCQC